MKLPKTRYETFSYENKIVEIRLNSFNNTDLLWHGTDPGWPAAAIAAGCIECGQLVYFRPLPASHL